MRRGTPGPGLDRLELPDVGEAEDDQAHAQGHDQRMDPEDADADAVHEPGQRGHERARRAIADGTPPGCGRGSPMTNAGHRGDGADRQVDAAGQHRQRLAAGQDRQRDGGPDDDVRPSSG